MNRRTNRRWTGTAGLLLALLGAAGATGDWGAVRGGTVVLLRHANAPGTGDPPGFRLGECDTQRNLDATGRAQARRIGEAFRARRVNVARVLTSRWCRARDTATLAFGSLARDAAAFDSFFGTPQQEAARTRAAREVLAGWRGPGVMVVVTHQVNITALTGVVPDSGEGVVVRADGKGVEVLGRVKP